MAQTVRKHNPNKIAEEVAAMVADGYEVVAMSGMVVVYRGSTVGADPASQFSAGPDASPRVDEVSTRRETTGPRSPMPRPKQRAR